MWRRYASTLLVCFFLLYSLNPIAFAKEWEGIIPLRSTREDVRKKFGKPSREHELEDTYDIRENQVKFWYATEACLGLTYYWGNYGVLPGTVLTITVHYDYDKAIPLADLNIPNIEKMKREVDSSNTIYMRISS